MLILSNLTGKEFYWSVLSGGKKLIEHQEEINRINVFPVPDGDTGSNLAATATSIIYNSKEDTSISIVASSIGDAALDGARGNSGVIFAQFLYSIGQEMSGVVSLSTQKFGDIVKKASEYLYDSIPSPQEGTIISVIREWAEFIHEKKDEVADFETLLEKAEEVAHKALAKTSEQLEAMRLAKVVDAGAKGFVLFIEGMKETIINKSFSREDHDMDHLLMADTDLPIAEAETLTEESLHNRYCTETCIIGSKINKADVLKILEEDSDSIVTAGSDSKLRLHFHTNHPAQMFDKLRQFGNFTFQKIEDMRRQYTTTHHRKHPIAIVIDSSVALDNETIDENQLHFIPLTLDVDGNVYYDSRSFDTELFIERQKANPAFHLKSSQPSPKTFADTFTYLSKYYESIILLTIGKKLSGTYNSAIQGVDLVKKNIATKIDVINTENLSAGAGAIAQCMIDDLNKGLSHDEIVKNAATYIKNTRNFVNFKTIDHMIAGGRLSSFQGKIINFLKLFPLVEVVDGKAAIIGKAFGFKKAFQKNLLALKKIADEKTVKHYVVSHAITDKETLTELLDQIKEIFGNEPSSISMAPPSIVSHVGLGAICVGLVHE